MQPQSIKILNLDIHCFSQRQLLHELQSGVLFTPNVNHLMRLQRDQNFYNLYQQADYRVCDSRILMLLSRFLGTPIRHKISGSDFFPAFCHYHQLNPEIKIFLLGAAPGVAQRAARNLNQAAGRTLVVGHYSPPYDFEQHPAECQSIVDQIHQSGATVLAVGMTPPKQETFIFNFRHQLSQVKIFMAVGATLDFEAGRVPRAPRWMRHLGLEWLFRLLSEPLRLWKRYLVEDPAIFWLVFKQKLGIYINPFAGVLAEADVSGTRPGGLRVDNRTLTVPRDRL